MVSAHSEGKGNKGKHMEILGFILFIIGAAGMDSPGNWYKIAIAVCLLGILLIVIGLRREGKHVIRR